MEAAARAGAAVEALQLEDRLEDSILQQASESVKSDTSDPVRAARDLQNLQQEWRRDKRAVDLLSGLLGSSSGGSGGGVSPRTYLLDIEQKFWEFACFDNKLR